MQFQVPQFIEHEPKVIGPFTFKQFVYLAVPGAVAFFFYFTAPFQTFVIVTIILGFVGFALGFVQIGGRSLPTIFLNVIGFSIAPKTYIWQKNARRGVSADTKQYGQTTEQQVVAGQIKLKQSGSMKNLTQELQTKK